MSVTADVGIPDRRACVRRTLRRWFGAILLWLAIASRAVAGNVEG